MVRNPVLEEPDEIGGFEFAIRAGRLELRSASQGGYARFNTHTAATSEYTGVRGCEQSKVERAWGNESERAARALKHFYIHSQFFTARGATAKLFHDLVFLSCLEGPGCVLLSTPFRGEQITPHSAFRSDRASSVSLSGVAFGNDGLQTNLGWFSSAKACHSGAGPVLRFCRPASPCTLAVFL
jgi:hypothetical protein